MLNDYNLVAKYDSLAESIKQQNQTIWLVLQEIIGRLQLISPVGLGPEAHGSQTVGDQPVYDGNFHDPFV